ncbi:helix-turn-helix domain-containing protein [Bordetella petrii]|uniref:helix-turn-helix domain-containing protein n=1 Tax=Bordetella petrii TaxID=94624 RepID=UPI001E2F7487|nr:helix-turn-helix domain-containing protein [Bordetella petrii]MCD0503677.1 helix-turn-helix domain-containing protein [Bordetella petrii]
MSIKIMSLVWEHYPSGGGELLTALAYADHAHDDGTGVRPSVAYIARKTRQSERTVQRYLTQMRESGWLLTVRHGTGGRGRATEYRINPLWITNPVKLAPFTKNDAERVTNSAQKGDTEGMKRVTRMSPQPSLTVLEPTTTSNIDFNNLADSVDKLSLPVLFQKSAQASVEQILRDCPTAARQLVLDEVAGLAVRGKVRHPIPLLRKLASSARQGLFVPDAALDVQRKREAKSMADQQKQLEALQRDKSAQTPEDTSRLAKDRLVALKQLLNSGNRTNKTKVTT